jgi:hypothetical protein
MVMTYKENEMKKKNVDKAVDLFLCWELPKDFHPDCGISFDGRKDDEWNKNKTWPTGTNLFTATQAKQMLLHCIGIYCVRCDEGEMEVVEGIPTCTTCGYTSEPVTLFQCGPSKCDHDYQGHEDILNENGKCVGGTTVCTKCGARASDEAAWS